MHYLVRHSNQRWQSLRHCLQTVLLWLHRVRKLLVDGESEEHSLPSLGLQRHLLKLVFSSDRIAEIVGAVNIPVIANGDIDSPHAAATVLSYTGADAVMIGRAAQGQPWLCGEIARHLDSSPALAPITLSQKLSIAHRHIDSLHKFYGEMLGVRIARKHFAWYMQYITPDASSRRIFNGLQTAAEQLIAIETYESNHHQHTTEQEVLAA